MSIINTTSLAAWLGIPDSENEAQLASAVAATNRAVVRYCGRSFETTTTGSASELEFVAKSPTLCITEDFWTTENLTVKVGDDGVFDETLTIGTDFYVAPVNGREDGIDVPYRRLQSTSWVFPTCDRPTVQVTAAWGWEAVPDEVTQAALIKAARVFKRKDSVEGVLGGFQEFTAVRVSSREDPDVVELLRYYRTSTAQLLVT